MHTPSAVALLETNILTPSAEPQDLPHQAEACESAEAEPPHPPVDPPEDQQHHQVRLRATPRRAAAIATPLPERGGTHAKDMG
jgi:hypothetical protein